MNYRNAFCAAAALAITLPSAQAQSTWTGASNDLFGESGNWDNMEVPSTDDNIEIPGGEFVDLDGMSFAVNRATLGEDGANAVILRGGGELFALQDITTHGLSLTGDPGILGNFGNFTAFGNVVLSNGWMLDTADAIFNDATLVLGESAGARLNSLQLLGGSDITGEGRVSIDLGGQLRIANGEGSNTSIGADIDLNFSELVLVNGSADVSSVEGADNRLMAQSGTTLELFRMNTRTTRLIADQGATIRITGASGTANNYDNRLIIEGDGNVLIRNGTHNFFTIEGGPLRIEDATVGTVAGAVVVNNHTTAKNTNFTSNVSIRQDATLTPEPGFFINLLGENTLTNDGTLDLEGSISINAGASIRNENTINISEGGIFGGGILRSFGVIRAVVNESSNNSTVGAEVRNFGLIEIQENRSLSITNSLLGFNTTTGQLNANNITVENGGFLNLPGSTGVRSITNSTINLTGTGRIEGLNNDLTINAIVNGQNYDLDLAGLLDQQGGTTTLTDSTLAAERVDVTGGELILRRTTVDASQGLNVLSGGTIVLDGARFVGNADGAITIDTSNEPGTQALARFLGTIDDANTLTARGEGSAVDIVVDPGDRAVFTFDNAIFEEGAAARITIGEPQIGGQRGAEPAAAFSGDLSIITGATVETTLAGLTDTPRLTVEGDTTLDHADLTVNVPNNWRSAPGDIILIETIGTLTGGFNNLTEGEIVAVSVRGNRTAIFSSTLGDGNDIGVTIVPAPACPLAFAIAALSTQRRQRGTNR